MASSGISILPRFFYNPFEEERDQPYTLRKEFWLKYIAETFIQCMKNIKPKAKRKYCDGGLYHGSLGLIYTASELLKHDLFDNQDKSLVLEYVSDCLKANQCYFSDVKRTEEVGFLCDKGGIYIAACIAARIVGDEEGVQQYAKRYAKNWVICEPLDFNHGKGSDELFVGRAGYLW